MPLPGVATIIAASMAISSSQNANDLLGYLERILLEGFVKRNIRITSYAADGTGTERSVQKLLTNLAPATKEYIIKHPGKGRPDITLKIPLFGPNRQPIVMIQDSKHAAKTYRNNAFSGARLLILGNYVVLYSHFRAIAFEGGPLYNRDVEKIDRQDDNAATRFGSGDVLQWLIENHPELLGPIVFLFVKYELIDGYQSRSMRHIERAQLALRALFFMEMWEQFLNEAGYPKAKHFLSHEACDITRFLIHGLLQLIIVYRDLLDDVYPLLPWLLSTEVCEHVFGLCRQIVKDFTEMDFIYMIPKLFIRLREHALFSHFSDGKERASGYNHTYTDNCGVNLVNLSIYPTDNEINNIAQVAYEEAENLWALLGAPPMLFTDSAVKLPSIHAWFAEPSFGDRTETSDDNGQLEEEEIDSDYESCVGGWDSDDEEPSEAAQIQDVLNYLEKVSLDSFAQEDEVNNLACAAVALSVQDEMTMYVFLVRIVLMLQLTCFLDMSYLSQPTKKSQNFMLKTMSGYLTTSPPVTYHLLIFLTSHQMHSTRTKLAHPLSASKNSFNFASHIKQSRRQQVFERVPLGHSTTPRLRRMFRNRRLNGKACCVDLTK